MSTGIFILVENEKIIVSRTNCPNFKNISINQIIFTKNPNGSVTVIVKEQPTYTIFDEIGHDQDIMIDLKKFDQPIPITKNDDISSECILGTIATMDDLINTDWYREEKKKLCEADQVTDNKK